MVILLTSHNMVNIQPLSGSLHSSMSIPVMEITTSLSSHVVFLLCTHGTRVDGNENVP